VYFIRLHVLPFFSDLRVDHRVTGEIRGKTNAEFEKKGIAMQAEQKKGMIFVNLLVFSCCFPAAATVDTRHRGTGVTSSCS
jgi:hypothetical protein